MTQKQLDKEYRKNRIKMLDVFIGMTERQYCKAKSSHKKTRFLTDRLYTLYKQRAEMAKRNNYSAKDHLPGRVMPKLWRIACLEHRYARQQVAA